MSTRQDRHTLPLRNVLRFLLALALRHERNLGDDVADTLRQLKPPPRIIDDAFIPPNGPFVLVANHYERPGLRVYWAGMLASYAVSRRRRERLHWLMTSEWYNYRVWGVPAPVAVVRWLFRRLARVYGLIIMPRAAARRVGRAAAIRSVLAGAEKEREPIALFPEAVGKGRLIRPPAAIGGFLLLLSQRGVPLLPAGIYEEDGALTVRFGPAFTLARGDGDQAEASSRARDNVMVSIGRLLPPDLWGVYEEQVAGFLTSAPP